MIWAILALGAFIAYTVTAVVGALRELTKEVKTTNFILENTYRVLLEAGGYAFTTHGNTRTAADLLSSIDDQLRLAALEERLRAERP